MAKKIPKTIHYVWVGGNEKPEIIKHCISSWKKYMPEFEIKEWNEHNFDLTKYQFALEAYNRKRYAFVTDVVRLAVLKEYGGIYMDSDVEVIRSLKKFLIHSAFTGHETDDLLVTATMGAIPNHPWISMLLDYYTDRPYSEITNTQIITALSRPLIERESYGHTYLKDGVVIFPRETFCPFDHQRLSANPTENTYAIHHFAGSWTNRAKK